MGPQLFAAYTEIVSLLRFLYQVMLQKISENSL